MSNVIESLGIAACDCELKAARLPRGSWERASLMQQSRRYRELQFQQPFMLSSCDLYPHANVLNEKRGVSRKRVWGEIALSAIGGALAGGLLMAALEWWAR